MNQTKIDWCDMSWNPVTGCRHDCPYCYARGITRRYGINEADDGDLHDLMHPRKRAVMMKNGACQNRIIPYPFGFSPTFHRYRLGEPARKTKPQTIFVCSMADLFGAWAPDGWIEEVFTACAAAPQHRYLFLTKHPERYGQLHNKGLLPDGDNYWFGTTVTKNIEGNRIGKLVADRHSFVSIEPLLGEVILDSKCVEWVIIGAESGNRREKVIPEKVWTTDIVQQCAAQGVPVFMKESLRAMMGNDFVQEFPQCGWRKRP